MGTVSGTSPSHHIATADRAVSQISDVQLRTTVAHVPSHASTAPSADVLLASTESTGKAQNVSQVSTGWQGRQQSPTTRKDTSLAKERLGRTPSPPLSSR